MADLPTRLEYHNAGANVFTARDRPMGIVLSLELRSERAALQFEQLSEVRLWQSVFT